MILFWSTKGIRMFLLNKKEKSTFKLLILSSFFLGFFISFTNTQDIIAKKALGALDWQLTILAMIWPVSNFTSIWWGKILENSKNKSLYFLIVGFFGRLILVSGLWIINMNQYLILIGVVLSFNALFIPAQNSIYQTNIRKQNRGTLYGIAMSVATLIGMILSYFYGKILDYNDNFFKYILLFVGITGFISSFLLYLIKTPENSSAKKNKLTIYTIFLEPIKRTFEIFKKNKEFLHFERSFIIYGMGFIMMIPAIPIFFVEELHLTYTKSFIAKAIIAQLGLLFLSPFMGKLLDNKHPNYFNRKIFSFLSLYPAFLLLSSIFNNNLLKIGFVYFAYLLFGIAMAGVNVSWNMGSIFFAGNEDSSMYQSIHVTLTGVRGIFAPLLSLLIKRIFNVYAVFIAAIIFFLLAALSSWFSYKENI